MGLRELKETAHQQFVRGKFAQCAQTYHQILRLAPRDPNMRVRHAEACRRAGDRLQAIASYRAAADLLLEIGCETRARGALKAALELDPRDPLLQADIARLGPHHEEPLPPSLSERDERSLLSPLEPARTSSLPPIQRVSPVAASVSPPALRPAPTPPILQPRAGPPVIQAPAATAPTPTLSPSSDLSPRMEVRRLSPSTLAFRCSPKDSWALVRSQTPLEMYLVEDLEKLPPQRAMH